MTLPEIPSLPIPPLPIEIPLLMHPVVAHFAIAIPVIVLLLELANLFAKRRGISVASLVMIIAMMFIYVALFITGKVDGTEGYIFLSEAGQDEFKEHKLIGLYLIYATAIVAVFKILAMLIQKTAFKIFFVLLLVGFVGVNMYQGKEGGDLVYEFGMNNVALSDAQDQMDELNDEIDELKEQLEAANELTCKEVQESIDQVLEEDEAASEAAKTELPTDTHVDENGIIDTENQAPKEAA
ncbi:MAG: DUF2231 domain-containing protein [Campylobacterota bacterium]|nr:DUF2231 domain-containing protein [Campylobacterota bacterium]